MNKTTGSSATESWDTGMSKPVFRKGIVCHADIVRIREAPSAMSKCVLGVVEGMELEILGEVNGFYKVRLYGNVHPALVGYISSRFVKEARDNGW